MRRSPRHVMATFLHGILSRTNRWSILIRRCCAGSRRRVFLSTSGTFAAFVGCDASGGTGKPAVAYEAARSNARAALFIDSDGSGACLSNASRFTSGCRYLSERSVRATLRALASYSAASASSLTVNWGSLTPTARRWQFMARSRSFSLSSIASLAGRSLAILPLHYGSM
jgi:hypothetical protein